jgi:outer membrane protein TolC
MKIRLALFPLFGFCVAVGAWGQQPGPAEAVRDGTSEVLTLDEAVRLALENNRGLRIALLEVGKAEDKVAAARTRRLPSSSLNLFGAQLLREVDFEFREGVFGTFPGTGPIPAADTNITTPRRPIVYAVGQVSQPLSQLYEINLDIQKEALGRTLAEAKAHVERQDVVNNVKKLYYAALETESALTASEESLTLYRELDRLTAEYVLQQVALKADNLDVKARLAKEEYNALSLRNQLATQKEELNDLMGRDVRTQFRLSPVAEATAYEVELSAAQARALELRPELREARVKVRQAEQDRRIKRAEYIPDVSLSLNYISPFNVEMLPTNVLAVGLWVSWEPWDWGRKKRELEEKNRAIEQAEMALRETESRVLLEVNQKQRKLVEARALLRFAAATQQAAQEILRVSRNRFAEQAALLKDVLQAQEGLADANHTYQQAVLAFWVARADFERALGEEK